ncbi:TonB C-terminal domain-containing protein [bacterium]|nr:MAG: TonB C-terminal domain-containing protein [bacterium]
MSFAGIPETAPLSPFLKRSLSVHGVLFAAALVAAHRGGKEPEQVYRIDFIGGSPAILNRQAPAEPAPAPAAPLPAPSFAKPERQKDPDSFNLRKPSFLAKLPRPSFLDAARPEKTPPAAPSQRAAPPAASGAAAGTGPSDGLGSVSADMPDFPYPWYLTLLRQKIWDQWSARMPPDALECLVQFSILRDGSITDVRVEESSGEQPFDYAATAAVRGAVPLPPLPPQFKERFLKVHIQFKAR